jgi:hypothetical protein
MNFPYHFPHHQVLLGLATRRLTPGGLSLLARPLDALLGEDRLTAAADALSLCSALSPPQQELLAAPPPFAMFNVTLGDLQSGSGWDGPRLTKLMIDLAQDQTPPRSTATRLVFYTHVQEGIVEGPPGENPGMPLSFPSATGARLTLTGQWVSEGDPCTVHPMDYMDATPEDHTRRRRLRLVPRGTTPDYSTRFTVAPVLGEGKSVAFGEVVAGFDVGLHLAAGSPEDFNLTGEQVTYLIERIGAAAISGRALPFEKVRVLIEQLAVTTGQLDELLARGDHAPTLSPHVVLPPALKDGGEYEAAAAAPYQYGAVYVHAGMPEPMTIENEGDDSTPDWRVNELSLDRLDRLQRMVRLQRWTGLAYGDLDQLVTGASRAEAGHSWGWHTNPTAIPLSLTLSRSTMRVLGAYDHFHARYGINAADFSVLFAKIAVHGSGGKPSQFDRWFNPGQVFEAPLVLDHTELPTSLGPDQEETEGLRAVRKLCAALGLLPVESSYGRVATAVQAATDGTGTPLTLSRKSVSAFFRISRGAAMFGMGATDLLALLDLIGGTAYRDLAIAPSLRTGDATESADTLDVWLEVAAVADWLAGNRWTVSHLLHLLHLDGGRLAADASLVQLVRTLAANLAPSLLDKATLVHPDLPTEVDWLKLLCWQIDADPEQGPPPLVDEHGLVPMLALLPEDELLAMFRLHLEQAWEPAGMPPYEEDLKTKAVEALAAFVLATSQSQERALGVTLNQILTVPADVAPLVVRWAGRSPGEEGAWSTAGFLSETLVLAARADLKPEHFDNAYLEKVYAIRRHAMVRELAAISAAQLRVLLVHPAHFGLDDDHLSLDAIYLLMSYSEWREQSDVPEDAVLAYLAGGALIDDPAQLALLLDWTAEELVDALDDETPPRCWRTLNTLLCRKAAGAQAALPMATLRSLTSLTVREDWPTWVSAGEAVMAGLPG